MKKKTKKKFIFQLQDALSVFIIRSGHQDALNIFTEALLPTIKLCFFATVNHLHFYLCALLTFTYNWWIYNYSDLVT